MADKSDLELHLELHTSSCRLPNGENRCLWYSSKTFWGNQSYIYQVLQTIQMKLILLCVLAEPAVLGSAKTALKFIYEI